MDKKKVKDRCQELRDLIDLGPGRNVEMLRKALGTVRTLRTAAQWEYPRQILDDLKERLGVWFSARVIRGDNAELRRALLQDLTALYGSWEPEGSRD